MGVYEYLSKWHVKGHHVQAYVIVHVEVGSGTWLVECRTGGTTVCKLVWKMVLLCMFFLHVSSCGN